jgi:hypothetical protein
LAEASEILLEEQKTKKLLPMEGSIPFLTWYGVEFNSIINQPNSLSVTIVENQ